MNTLAIILVLISAIFHSVRNIFTKISSNKQAFLWWYTLFGLLYFLPVYLIYFREYHNDYLYVISLSILSGFLHFLYWVFLAKAYKTGDISLAYPIMRSSPPLVLLIALLFLKEDPSIAGIIGIILVTLGLYGLSSNCDRLSQKPSPNILRNKYKSIKYALLGLVSVTAYSIADKLIVSVIHPIQFVYLHMLFGFIFFSFYIFLKKDYDNVLQEWKASKRNIVITGFFGIYGYMLIMVAFTMASVSYVISLRQLSIVFVVLWGVFYLKEDEKQKRLVSASIITVGTIVISILG